MSKKLVSDANPTQLHPTARKRVLSGIQPSGDVHLGNYLGAIKGWVDRQEEKENYFCIVDLHALTLSRDPTELRSQTRTLAAILFAAGLDPLRCTVFIQSHVRAHAECCWILNCITPVGWLERMTQYKDKSKIEESVPAGLLDYPVLMAGDILLYDADEVPVGEDQKQHVEITRDIGQRFNHLFGDTFVIPKAVIPEVGARVMGLDNPANKMSKTFSHNRGHSVRLLDSPEEVERTIKRAVTDTGNDIRFSESPDKAGVNNLLGIYKGITGKTDREVEKDFSGSKGYGDLKKKVAEVVIAELKPIRERYSVLVEDVGELDRLLADGAEQAQAIAERKIEQIKNSVGLVLPEMQGR